MAESTSLDSTNSPTHTVREFPKALPLRRLLGPSFILLALGLGSGELILWPYLSANFGLGIAWGAVLGISLQYLINLEIERYALLKGESVFVGLYRLAPQLMYWFIISTFVGFALPGIIASSAEIMAHLVGISAYRPLAIGGLIGIGLLLSAARRIYPLVEKITKTLIVIGLPGIVLLAISSSSVADWTELAEGLIGKGRGYWLLPSGISLATFLGAFAYSGAAGNLNLAQSVYVKEKGYGMGRYAAKLAGLFSSHAAERRIRLTGTDFVETPENIARFRVWWRRIAFEHGLVFWFLGALAMCLLMVIAHVTTQGLAGNGEGIAFVLTEGRVLGERIFPAVGSAFLVIVAIMLFQTELGVLDSTSRIMAENWGLIRIKKLDDPVDISRYYYLFLWLQIIFGIVCLVSISFSSRAFLVIGAVFNAIAMFVHIGLVQWLNYRTLPRSVQPGLIRRILLLMAFIIFGSLSIFTLYKALQQFLAA